jgi:hypothetical protein
MAMEQELRRSDSLDEELRMCYMAMEREPKRSDGLEKELRLLYGYGAWDKAVRWLGGRAKNVIWLWSRG